jgi:putative heme iron utilization protein
LARHEGNFRVGAEEPLSLDDLFALLGEVEGDDRARNDAIACALSASEGWQEAVRRLRGAFAEEASGLRERKDELPDD